MTKYQSSMQIWKLLTAAAPERKIYTYGEIAGILAYGSARTMGRFLHPIMRLCEDNKYPPLTILVVRKDTGAPGKGLTTIDEINSDRERVFNFAWSDIKSPQIEDFKKAAEQQKA